MMNYICQTGDNAQMLNTIIQNSETFLALNMWDLSLEFLSYPQEEFITEKKGGVQVIVNFNEKKTNRRNKKVGFSQDSKTEDE